MPIKHRYLLGCLTNVSTTAAQKKKKGYNFRRSWAQNMAILGIDMLVNRYFYRSTTSTTSNAGVWMLPKYSDN